MCWKHSKHSVVSMGKLFSARTRSSVSWRCCAEAIRSALADILSGCSLAAAAAGLKYPVFLPLAAAIRHKTDPPVPLPANCCHCEGLPAGRSADLYASSPPQNRGQTRRSAWFDGGSVIASCWLRPDQSPSLPAQRPDRRYGQTEQVMKVIDRKSTRLNSSHV